MDHYIVEFNRHRPDRVVKDYAVYLEKKQGLARLNPFASSEQLVIYLTDKGSYCLQVRGMGDFTHPAKIEKGSHHLVSFTHSGKTVHSAVYGKMYGYVRKWTGSCCSSFADFAAMV